MALGLIRLRIVANGAGVPNQPLQILLASGSFQHIYQDSSGAQLISSQGYCQTDAQGWLSVYAQDTFEYQARILSSTGAVLQTEEGIYAQTPLNSTPHINVQLSNDLLTSQQISASPTGLVAATPAGTLVLPDGTTYQDPDAKVEIRLNGATIGAAHALEFTAPSATAIATGNKITVNLANQIPVITTKDEGTAVANALSELNFTGAGVTTTGSGNTVTVAIPGNALAIKDEGVSLTPAATSINVVGSGVTATTVAGDVTLTIPGNALAIKDEGVSLTPAATSINVVGDAITATQVGNDVTITANRTPIVTGKGSTDFTTDTRRLNFQGAGVTVTGVAGEAQINIPAVPVQSFAGTTALNAVTSVIRVTGGGANVSAPVAGELLIDIPAAVTEAIVTTATALNITAAHNGQRIVVDSASTQALIVDANLPANFRCRIVQAGTGVFIVGAGPGTTVNSETGSYSSHGKGSIVDLVQTAPNVYALSGGLALNHTEVHSVNGFTGAVTLDVNHIPGAVARVNGFAPDATGNVIVDAGAITGVVKSVNSILPDATGALTIPAATQLAQGLMSALDKQKLDALPTDVAEAAQDAAATLIAAGTHTGVTATYNDVTGSLNLNVTPVPTNLTVSTAPGVVQVASSTGTAAMLPAATQVAAGVMSAADKQKLDAVPAVITVYTDEMAQDAAAAAILAGAHVGVTPIYDDAANKLNLVVAPTDLSVATTSTTNVITSSTGNDVTLQAATLTAAGLMTASDRVLLNNVAAGTVGGSGTGAVALTSIPSATSVSVTPAVGTGAVIAAATASTAGVMSAADKQKLDSLSSGGSPGTSISVEDAQDAAASLFTSGTHTGLNVAYDDANGRITLEVVNTDITLGPPSATSIPLSISTGADVVLPAATNATAGLLTAADKVKLDALPNNGTDFIEAAQDAVAAALAAGSHVGINVVYSDVGNTISLINTGGGSGSGSAATNLSVSSVNASSLTVASSTGTAATLPAATASTAGVMSAADKQKLDGISGTGASTEDIQDAAAALITSGVHTGVTATYDDTNNRLNLAVTGGAAANLTLGSTSGTTLQIANSNGTGVTLPSATNAAAGLMSASDKQALDAAAAATTGTTLQEAAQDAAAAALVAGTHAGITVSYNDATNAISLTAAPTNISAGTATATTVPLTSSTGTGVTLTAATASVAGLMSAADKVKLDALPADSAALTEATQDAVAAALAAGTHTNITVSYDDSTGAISLTGATAGAPAPTNLGVGTRTATDVPLTSSTGTGVTLPVATPSVAGTMSAADKTKLDTITNGATAYTDEQAQDAAASLFTSGTHTGLTATYDDANGKLNLAVTTNGSTNLMVGTASATTLQLNSSTGTGATLPAATTTAAGLMAASDKVKLDALPADAAAQKELIEDTLAGALAMGTHTNITVVYDDATGALSLQGVAAGTPAPTNIGIGPRTATDVPLTSSTGTGVTFPAATTSLAGSMTAADKAKLDALPADAAALSESIQDTAASLFTSATHTGVTVAYDDANNKLALNVSPTNLSFTQAATSGTVTSSTGTSAVIPSATTTNAGLMSSSDKTKLDALPATAVTQYTDEMAQDATATMIAAGAHIATTVVYNDTNGTMSIGVPSAFIVASPTPPVPAYFGARWHNTTLNQRFEFDGAVWVSY